MKPDIEHEKLLEVKNKGNKLVDILEIIAKNYTAELGRYFKKHEINDLSFNGQSVLHLTVFLGQLEMTRYLLEVLGADPNLKDTVGRTPLHIACFYSFESIVSVLLENNALVDDMCYERARHDWCGSKNSIIIDLLDEWKKSR